MTARIWRLGAVGALACGVCAIGGMLLGACASDESGAVPGPEGPAVVPATDAATLDGSPDDADAGPCTSDDCEYFPSTCAPDVLCLNGPFDPTNPDVGLDWRTRINVIRGRSASDVWAAGAIGAMAHFDGTAWTVSDVGTQETQRALWLRGSSEVALGSIERIHARGLGAGTTDAAVSPGGWSLSEPALVPDDFGRLGSASWSPPGSDVLWLSSETALWRLHLTPESQFEILPGIPTPVCGSIPCNAILSIHSASAKTLWAVGEFGAALRISDADGDSPTVTQLNSLTVLGLSGVWAASDTDVWAVGGSGTIRHYTGDPVQWGVVADVPTTVNLNAVWGTSSSDVWVAGNAGVVLHYDGTTWSRVKIAGLGARRPDLFAVWSPAPGHVWVGGYGVVLVLGGNP